LPSIAALRRKDWQRGGLIPLRSLSLLSPSFRASWSAQWPTALPVLLWLTHPSAQNMSPFAGRNTGFHRRMCEARDSLRDAARSVLGFSLPERRAEPPATGIYALAEWRDRIAPRNAELDRLWREKGV
jgi:hypothetical protein